MEVRELAPALLALADLFREANTIVSPDSPPVDLKIEATAAGSFEVHLLLEQATQSPGFVRQVVDFFQTPIANGLVNLKDLILGPTFGLLMLIQRLHLRRLASREVRADGTTVLVMADGDRLEVPSSVLEMYEKVTIRRRVRQVLAPLEREGVERVRFVSDTTAETTIEVRSRDLPAYEVQTVEERLTDNALDMSLSIASVAFTEGNKWRLSDGDHTFFAQVEDKEFLERVDRGEEAFRKGDILACRVRIEQVRDETGLHTAYTVTKVKNHTPAAQPLRLFTADESAG